MAPTVPTPSPPQKSSKTTGKIEDKKPKASPRANKITKKPSSKQFTSKTFTSNIFAVSRTSVPQIRKVAKELKIEHYSSLSKSQLLLEILSQSLASQSHKSLFNIAQTTSEVRDMAIQFGIEDKLQEKDKYEVMRLILEKQVKEEKEKKNGGEEWKDGITRMRLRASELGVKNYTQYSKDELRDILKSYDDEPTKKNIGNVKGKKGDIQMEDEEMEDEEMEDEEMEDEEMEDEEMKDEEMKES